MKTWNVRPRYLLHNHLAMPLKPCFLASGSEGCLLPPGSINLLDLFMQILITASIRTQHAALRCSVARARRKSAEVLIKQCFHTVNRFDAYNFENLLGGVFDNWRYLNAALRLTVMAVCLNLKIRYLERANASTRTLQICNMAIGIYYENADCD